MGYTLGTWRTKPRAKVITQSCCVQTELSPCVCSLLIDQCPGRIQRLASLDMVSTRLLVVESSVASLEPENDIFSCTGTVRTHGGFQPIHFVWIVWPHAIALATRHTVYVFVLTADREDLSGRYVSRVLTCAGANVPASTRFPLRLW